MDRDQLRALIGQITTEAEAASLEATRLYWKNLRAEEAFQRGKHSALESVLVKLEAALAAPDRALSDEGIAVRIGDGRAYCSPDTMLHIWNGVETRCQCGARIRQVLG